MDVTTRVRRDDTGLPGVADGTLSPAVLLIAVSVLVLLLVFASGYGYHRDELYFLAAARHLSWAYPDQGPLTPLMAALMNAVAPGSLTLLRVPSAIAATSTVLVTALLCRQLDGGRGAQVLSAACSAVAVIVVFTGHTLSTTTFDLLVWALVTWLAVAAVRTGRPWLWPVAGAVLGLGLENKALPAFLAVALVAGLLMSGPRLVLREPRFWLGAVIALLLWSPWLIWQTANGWPQLAVSSAIAGGASASSAPWWQVVPFQALMSGPLLAPVWVAGLVRLFRDPRLHEVRFLGWAWVVLAAVFTLTGGKPYYLAGFLPLLHAAGAVPAVRWLDRGGVRRRRSLLVGVVAFSAVAGCVIALPILPMRQVGPVVALNADVGETIGWPDLVGTVADVAANVPHREHFVILTANYGEAGAVDLYGPRLGLPPAYSGHNAYGLWGSPPDDPGYVIAVGYDLNRAGTVLRGCTIAARIHNGAGINNEENGKAILLCSAPRQPWPTEWRSIRHLN